MREPSPGERESFGYRVETRHLASALDGAEGGLFPNVYSTAFMVGLMEAAASRLLARHLESGEISVGAGLDCVTHLAPTPLGGQVTAEATYRGHEGRRVRFEVRAYDEQGLIGECVHWRAVVNAEAFQARTDQRAARVASGPRS